MPDTPKKTNRTRPANAGRKSKGGRVVRFRAAPDVVDILEAQPDMTAYFEAAIREKAGAPKPDA